MRLPLFVARLCFIAAVGIACLFCLCVVAWFLLVCVLLRVIAYALAFVCCEVAFHIRRVCILQVCFAFVSLVRSLVLVCMFCE